MAEIKQYLVEILNFEDDALRLFQKKTYQDCYTKFQTLILPIVEKIKSDELSNDQFVNGVVSFFVEDMEQYNKGFKIFNKSEALRRHNMYMVTYILPSLAEDEKTKQYAESLVSAWANQFKNSDIKVATYQEIASGFVTKLFGMIIQN